MESKPDSEMRVDLPQNFTLNGLRLGYHSGRFSAWVMRKNESLEIQ